MDVDAPSHETFACRWRKDLHVTRQNDEIDFQIFDQTENFRLLRRFRVGAHGEVVKWNAVPVRKRLQIRMIGYDGWNLDGKIARPVAV